MFRFNDADDVRVGANAADKVYLGSTLLWAASPPPSGFFVDNFTTADGWTNGDLVSSGVHYENLPEVINRFDRPFRVDTSAGRTYLDSTTFGGGAARIVGTGVGSDHYVEGDVSVHLNDNQDYILLFVRADASGNNFYFLQIAGQQYSIRKKTGGSTSTITTVNDGPYITAGARIRFAVTGSTLTASVDTGNGMITVATAADASFTSGDPGFGVYQAGGAVAAHFENIEVDNV